MFPGFETLETQILKLLTAFSMQFKEFQVFSYYFTQLIVQLSFPIKLHFLFSVITFLWSFHNINYLFYRCLYVLWKAAF